jgi:hypothetical protein
MEKPLRSAQSRNAPAYPRIASGSTRQYLRGRGLNPLTNKLAGAAGQVSRQLQAADPLKASRTLAATRSLSNLKRLAEAEIAPALEVSIGFSDSDGD